MAWKFPKRLPRTGQVVDAEDFNEGLQPFFEEALKLNEQNVSTDLQSQLTLADVDEDISFRTLHKSNFIDASEGNLPTTVTPFKVPCSEAWTPIPMDGTDTVFAFSSRGGALYIVASLQYAYSYFERTLLDTSTSPATLVEGDVEWHDIIHVQFGVRIDGAFEAISLVGDQDSLNAGVTMETGVSGLMQGVDIDICVPITPGRHTVEIVARCETVPGEQDRMNAYIYSTELLVWEIR